MLQKFLHFTQILQNTLGYIQFNLKPWTPRAFVDILCNETVLLGDLGGQKQVETMKNDDFCIDVCATPNDSNVSSNMF